MTKPTKPIKTTASAEIIVPPVPPLPECMLLAWEMSSVGYRGFWTYRASGTRSHCEERTRGSDRTYALITIAPPVPTRTAADARGVFAAFDASAHLMSSLSAFCDGWRGAERHHGITKETRDANE